MNSLHESPSAMPDPREYEAEQITDVTHEMLEQFPNAPGARQVQELVDHTRNGTLEQHVNQEFEQNLPDKLTQTSAYYAERLKGQGGVGRTILQKLKGTPETRKDVQAIIDAICTAPGGKKNLKHRYVEIQQHKGAPDWYGLKFKAIDRDKALLASLKGANPELSAEFAELEGALADYACQDPRIELYAWERRRSNNEVDRSIMHMGKIVIFLAAVAAAVGTGLMSLISRKFSITPLFYAAVAGLIASPTLRQRLFAGKSANMVADIDSALNTPQAKADSVDYAIHGKGWTRHTKNIMGNSPSVRAFMKELNKNGPQHIPEATVMAYVNKEIPASDPAARESLQKMILDGRYLGFVGRLQTVKSNEAKTVVSEYVKQGAAKFETQAVSAADEINEYEEEVALGYPESGFLGGDLNM